MIFDRRDFFKSAAGVTALTLGLNAYAPAILKRKLLAAPPAPGKKKLIFIFQRGGMDAINAVIPRGDPSYNRKNRPTLFIDPEDAIPLNGETVDPALRSFVQLHPSLAPMMEIYKAGDLAILHRVGYKNQSRSHFDSQQFYENGTNDPKLEEGMIYRHVVEGYDLPTSPFVALGLSSNQLTSLKGKQAIPNLSDVRTFKFAGSKARNLKFLGGAESKKSGVIGAYDKSSDGSEKPYRTQVFRTGLALADVMRKLRTIDPDTYEPANGATYPSGPSLYFKAKQTAQLLKVTPVQILGMNISGWDTHTNQGHLSGGYPDRLYQVAHVFRSLYRDLRDQWDDLLIISMTEFGRTSKENGSKGTDHGEAIAMFVAGGAVKGGVYNAASVDAWTQDGGIFSTSNNRYLRHWTDFRAVFAEIFMKHFGDDQTTLNKVILSYDKLAAANPKEYTQLGFL